MGLEGFFLGSRKEFSLSASLLSSPRAARVVGGAMEERYSRSTSLKVDFFSKDKIIDSSTVSDHGDQMIKSLIIHLNKCFQIMELRLAQIQKP